MRDLIRNYKLIIKGKIQPDSDNDLLVSSTSSLGISNSVELAEPEMFAPGTETEDEIPKKTSLVQDESQKSKRKKFLTRSYGSSVNIDEQQDSRFYNLMQFSSLNETTTLLPPKMGESGITTRSSQISSQSISQTSSQSTAKPSNNSLVTIFAVWNTTMGTSLLAMAWGLNKTGLLGGIVINLFVAAICLYTAYVLLKINEKHGISGEDFEVPDLCRLLIGRWAEIISKIFSLIVLIGGDIIYWILLSNFLYNLVVFISYGPDTNSESAVFCPKESNKTSLPEYSLNPTFNKVWNLYTTVPVFLAILMFPLLNFKSPTFFAKFNSLGTLCVGYLMVFVAVKFSKWGINIDSWTKELTIKSSFCVLTGMLELSYFIHNIIISVMKLNKHQENNGRDLTIAFSLITFTYLFLGALFYVSFPLSKACIQDNFLNNFTNGDIMVLVARILLFFQLFTVFPFVTYMLRTEIVTYLTAMYKKEKNVEFSYLKTIIININIVVICVLFACFLPRIGTLIRYTGAISGLIFIFIMPSLLKMASLRQEGSLTVWSVIIHVFIMILGILNLIAQFFVME